MGTAYENPPFERGKTFYGGRTIDTSNLEGLQYEGKEYEFNDENPALASVRSNRKCRVRVVRNWEPTGAAILPKNVVAGSTQAIDSSTYKERVILAGSLSIPQGVVDEYLPAAGAPVGDLCYIVIRGPSTVTSANTGTVGISVGTAIMTAASARAIQEDQASTGTSVFITKNARIGRALSAANTNTTDFVVDVELF